MGCCDDKPDVIWERKADTRIGRRGVLKGSAGLAGLAMVAGAGAAKAQEKIKLAFCSQLLCIRPTSSPAPRLLRGGGAGRRARLHPRRQRRDAGAGRRGGRLRGDLVRRGGAGLRQRRHIRRFATTGRLPLFALAVAPGEVETITSLKDLEGKTVGVSALGNADHTMLLYLLAEAGADPRTVEFAVLGPNLFEALRRGQVVAGMVQEPALTLIVEDGGKVLFNAMDIILYGGVPRPEAEGSNRQVARVEAQIIQRRVIRAGETCGYGATFTGRGGYRSGDPQHRLRRRLFARLFVAWRLPSRANSRCPCSGECRWI